MSNMEVSIVDRSRLADVLRGVGRSSSGVVRVTDGRLGEKLSAGSVGVGYCGGDFLGLPQFIVIPGSDRKEFFAWVNTFCPFVTPLSQWCRVVTQGELSQAVGARGWPEFGGTMAAWAGAMVGEAVLHMKTGAKLEQLSTAALRACATFVAARAFGLWEDRKVRAMAVERLAAARGMLGGAGGGLLLADWETAWGVLEELGGREGGMRQGGLWKEDLTVSACMDIRSTGFVSKETMGRIVGRLGWSEEFVEFEDVGAERRLRIFDAAVVCLERMGRNRGSREALGEFAVGYFAARIGGAASERVGLVENTRAWRPMVVVWYGVISALHRPEVWGAEFGGLGRLALRELAFPWRFCDPPGCDIAVEELAALREPGRKGMAPGFRSAMRRVVNVEVALGVEGAVPLGGAVEEHGGGGGGVEAMGAELVELNRHLAAATESARRLDQVYGSVSGAGGAVKSGVRKRTAGAAGKRGRGTREGGR